MYFEIVSTLSLVIGLIVVNVVRPGAGMNVDPASLDAGRSRSTSPPAEGRAGSAFCSTSFPTSVVDAFARGDILQVLLFSVLFGFALTRLGAAGAPRRRVHRSAATVLFGVVGFVMKTAPLGAFGAMAFTIGNFGVGTLAQLGTLIACFYATCLLFVFGVLGAIAWWHGFGIWRFITHIKEEIFIVFGTSSSESVLPRIMEKLEDAGRSPIRRWRRDSRRLFVQSRRDRHLSGDCDRVHRPGDQHAARPDAATDAARAAPGHVERVRPGSPAPRSSFLPVPSGGNSYIPVAGIALILGIHRFMGEAMAVTNLIGNGVATIVVGKWCGQVDEASFQG